MVKTAAVVRREVTDANIAQKWRAVWEWVWESFRLSCVERRRRQLSVLHFLLFRRDLGGTDLGIVFVHSQNSTELKLTLLCLLVTPHKAQTSRSKKPSQIL
jgi:hypothetical protein